MTPISRSTGVWLAVGTILSCGFPTTAKATLIGDEVRIQISSVDTTFVVSSGAAPDFSVSSFNWNVESSSILFSIGSIPNGNLAPGVVFTLSDLDWVGFPSGILVDASIVSGTGIFASATDSILTVADHSITVDLDPFAFGSLSVGPSMLISLQAHVPEPSTLLLVGTGLAVLGLARRRNGRAT